MKKLVFLFAFWAFATLALAQGYDPVYGDESTSAKDVPEPLLLPDFPITNGTVVYQRVFEFEKASQEQLYGIALRYVSEYYRSAKSVIDVTDPISGLVVVKGNFSVVSDVYYSLFGTQKTQQVKRTAHTMKIESRPGRIRVTIDNLVVINEPNPSIGVTYSEISIINLINEYEAYERTYANQKPKKNIKLQQVNRSILLDELDLNAYRFMEDLRPFFEKELREDW